MWASSGPTWEGGKFLIMPPGYDEPVPDGYFPYRSATNNVFVFLRSFYIRTLRI
jgi:hypothetical protein